MDALINNPFRILGLSPTASEKEIAKRVSDLLVYAEMSKTVKYESDFEFLGEVDRSPNNIKESAKRLEYNELKLFYSLMYFEIKDEDDRKAIQFIESKDHDSAIKIWEESIFKNCPEILRGWITIKDALRSPLFKEVSNDLYSIKIQNRKTEGTIQLSLFKDFLITTHFGENELRPIMESVTLIPVDDNYQVSCSFKQEENRILSQKFGLTLICSKDSIKHHFIIGLNGLFLIEEQSTEIQDIPKVIIQKHLITKSQDINRLYIKKYNGKIEVWFNEEKIFQNQNNHNYTAIGLRLSGSQKVMIRDFSISKLEHRKLYDSDIELNNKTHTYVKNLALVYILKAGHKLDIDYLHFFELIGIFFKQDFFRDHVRNITPGTYKIDYQILSNIFIEEFYTHFKASIDPTVKWSELYFYSPFRYLSDEAENKAKEKIISPRLYEFEEKIKDITNRRINKVQKCTVLAEELVKSASLFMEWYSCFYGYSADSFDRIQNKIGKELLECGITHYNDGAKNIKLAKESIQIIIQSSDYSRSEELRERIIKNLNIITNSHELDNIPIDFRKKDLEKYIDSITYKGKSDEKTKLSESETNNSKTASSKNITNTTTKKEVSKSKPKLSFKRIGQIILVIICLYAIFTVFRNTESETSNTKNRASNQIYSQLNNGAAPYFKYFGYPAIDDYSDNSITFKNGNQTDVIVCLENVNSGRTIRHNYIRAGTNFTMGNLPDGLYKIKTFYGNDWDSTKKIKNGQIVGGFKRNAGYSVSGSKGDFLSLSSSNDTYTNYTVTLYTVQNGNMQQRSSNSSEFFK